ncbi:YlbF family regulator [Paenibacillus sp. GCM10012307]|uniref:YlbF family regulator n=1 Tax=Paenibacillus roseus TaxID=2798579 RepID=A0A934JAI7_9BACL|nr:YlbF family regulator [Paenibacillus roseus]MBJ6363290.1 YlbF family regulator [Paenibacillus roseus]
MPTAEKTSVLPSDVFGYGEQVATLDMAGLLLNAYELGDMIIGSADVADYSYWKSIVAADEEVQKLAKQFLKAKDFFTECERFGRFHPDFHAAKDKVKQLQGELDRHECVRRFKEAEAAVDQLLYDISHLIASSVSDTIKVPGNESVGSGCGGGGSCSCGSGGCG